MMSKPFFVTGKHTICLTNESPPCKFLIGKSNLKIKLGFSIVGGLFGLDRAAAEFSYLGWAGPLES
jgi:hypothetical protein